MTTISATSTLSDVLEALPSRDSVTDTWEKAPPVAAITTWTTSVGLFGDYLSSFFADCATIGYTTCDPADYSAYSGWAIGVEFDFSTALTPSS